MQRHLIRRRYRVFQHHQLCKALVAPYTVHKRVTQPEMIPKLGTYRLVPKNMTKVNWKFLLMKSSKKCFIFLPAFYLTMWLMVSPKYFEKLAFENMTAGFLLRFQNSLRYEISLIYHWNIDSLMQNWSKKLSKCEDNNYYRGNIGENRFLSFLKMHY